MNTATKPGTSTHNHQLITHNRLPGLLSSLAHTHQTHTSQVSGKLNHRLTVEA
jgi:hypothetical protein